MNSSHANKLAFERLILSRPVLHTMVPAADICPPLKTRLLLHAGPPIEWDRMCGPMRGAAEAAIVYEGWAKSYAEARDMAAVGAVRFEPTHDHGFVGPVAGIISPSMWVFCVENKTYGNWAYCTMSEGLGRALRFGSQGEDILRRLKWMEEELAPVIASALSQTNGIDILEIIRQSLEMGDECHNRHEAARLIFLNQLWLPLLKSDTPVGAIERATSFIAANYYFFVNLSMAFCKASLDAIADIPNSSIVSTMTRNGVDFGIRVAGLGKRWFTAPASQITGLYFEGYGREDANPDLGDSSITETLGIGAFAMGASPSIARYIGSSPKQLTALSEQMYKITYGEHPTLKVPAPEYRGVPTGIDIRRVVETGILPIINTSIAHKDAGVGQIGAGYTRAPLACLPDALSALDDVHRGRVSS